MPGMRMSISTTSARVRAHQRDRLRAVGRLADHLEVVGASRSAPEAGPDQRLVVGEHHPDGHVASATPVRRQRRPATTKPPSAVGPGRPGRRRRSTRSRMPIRPKPGRSPVAPAGSDRGCARRPRARRPVDSSARSRRPVAVLVGVGERLLRRCGTRRAAVDVGHRGRLRRRLEPRRRPAAANDVDQGGELGEASARVRWRPSRLVGVAQHARASSPSSSSTDPAATADDRRARARPRRARIAAGGRPRRPAR